MSRRARAKYLISSSSGCWTGNGWSYDRNSVIYYLDKRTAETDLKRLVAQYPDKSPVVCAYSPLITESPAEPTYSTADQSPPAAIVP